MRRLIRDIAPSSASVAAVGATGSSSALSAGSAGGGDHHELGLAAAQSQLDRSRRQLAGDLVDRRRQRVLQGQPNGRLERCGEPLGQRAGLLPAGLGCGRELPLHVLDVRAQVHGAIMAPLWCHVNP